MTLEAWLTAIKDAALVGLAVFVLWYVHHADTNAAKVEDLQGVTQQLKTNAADAARYATEARNANAELASEVAGTSAAIANQHAPVLLCPVAAAHGAGAVPSAPAAPTGGAASTGGSNAGSGEDPRNIRPGVNALELKYEDALSRCRSVLNQWPK